MVYRIPRPSADSVTAIYIDDHYGRDHLVSEFMLQRRWARAKISPMGRRSTLDRRPDRR